MAALNFDLELLGWIEQFEAKAPTVSVQRTSQGTIAFFKQKFDPETGDALPLAVVKTTTVGELNDACQRASQAIELIQGFLAETDFGGSNG